MATKTRFSSSTQQSGSTSSIEDVVSYSKEDLNNAYEAFVTEDPKESNLSMFNIASVFGVFMLIMSAVYFLQIIGIQFGPNLSTFMEGLPIFGGIFVAITGLGFVLREHPKRKKNRDKLQFSSSSSGSRNATSSASFSNSASSSKNSKSKSSSLEDTWNSYKSKNKSAGREASSSSSAASSMQFKSTQYDEYALKQSKKLFKSRKDKKFAGVCGGIAKYLGVSSTVVRLIFVLSTLFFPVFNGLPLILYIVLAIVLNKEPQILEDK